MTNTGMKTYLSKICVFKQIYIWENWWFVKIKLWPLKQIEYLGINGWFELNARFIFFRRYQRRINQIKNLA